MPLRKKLISIINKQCDDIDERFDGYKVQIGHSIHDIFKFEQLHRIQHIDIQEEIDGICTNLANSLAKHKDRDSEQEAA